VFLPHVSPVATTIVPKVHVYILILYSWALHLCVCVDAKQGQGWLWKRKEAREWSRGAEIREPSSAVLFGSPDPPFHSLSRACSVHISETALIKTFAYITQVRSPLSSSPVVGSKVGRRGARPGFGGLHKQLNDGPQSPCVALFPTFVPRLCCLSVCCLSFRS